MITGNEEAFPRTSTGHLDSFVEGAVGLTIRQHFAAMAMQGLLSNANICDSKNEASLNWVSEGAVKFADAVINELNKEKP